MFPKHLCTLASFLTLVIIVSAADRLLLSPSFLAFLGTLEKYENAQNDVVFLLDDSASITAEKFPGVKKFSTLIAQRLSVSSEFSRVAILTFSTGTREHANYIENPDGNNMCSLTQRIDSIDYSAGWTHTSLAMREAETIFAQARPSSNKIIILLTDGQSNDGYSPVSISNELKSKGIIIFAVGVAEINAQEIYDVATTMNHTYLLDNFDLLESINRYLVKDLRDDNLDLEDPRYCAFNCDDNAKCYCGTRTGQHECVCNAGYFGEGGLKQCHKCPKGTFKNESANTVCTDCPEHSTTKNEGSVSIRDCECDSGYNKEGNLCSPIRCASLTAPDGGILVPNHCDNIFGSQCSFRCLDGYCPYSCSLSLYNQIHPNDDHRSLHTRTCLETGKWSNEEFLCEKMSCPSLERPENSNYNCSNESYVNGTVCGFRCDKGYKLTGSKSRTCLQSDTLMKWTGEDVKCEKIFCEKLHSNDVLLVKPEECSKSPMPYRTICTYDCVEGYGLVFDGKKTNGILECGPDGKWKSNKHGQHNRLSCKDTKPPEIKCPDPITVSALPKKEFAKVPLTDPIATDNVYVEDIRIIEPKNFTKQYRFSIGETKVVYEAKDSSKLSSTCSFLVTVKDNEPPEVLSCPKGIEIYHSNSNEISVEWKGPLFEDNSGSVKFTSNRKSGDKFSWGPPSTVYFNASDPSNNTASCSFEVRVKPYECPYYNPPANGVVTCDKWNQGRICSVFCHDEFEFAAANDVHKVYLCNANTKTWLPFNVRKPLKMPWPDCSRKQSAASLKVSTNIIYKVDSCRDEVLEKMRLEFFKIAKTLPPVLCPRNKGCSPENVKVTCNPITTRRKRSFNNDLKFRQPSSESIKTSRRRFIREANEQKLTISFDLEVLPNVINVNRNEKDRDGTLGDTFEEGNLINLSSKSYLKELENEISLKVKDIYNISSVPSPEVDYGVVALCSTGQLNVNNTCVNCPFGTYKNDVSETCIYCPKATYQDEERQLSCKSCPVGYTTYEIKSKSRTDCKGPCQPGTYSKTAFEPCFACPLHTYQDRSTRKGCMKCPPGLFTWKVGANSSSDCVAPCKPGSFSDTGYEPCTLCDIGFYQNKEMQKICEVCPSGTSTTAEGELTVGNCKEIDVCNELRPCQHNSTCVQFDKGFECICPEGLLGKRCEINFDECVSSPCFNGGTCIDDIGNFTCLCSGGWAGHQCEINKDDCASNPCFNSGECIDKVNAFECHCMPGFEGERCERNIYECESNPCLNNGTCFDKINSYRCCCAEGYIGLNCEYDTHVNDSDICDTVVCHNGGSCLAEDDGFNCSCLSGFKGTFCEINIDDCEDFHCDNGGLCIDGIENATCKCPKRYSGPHCETSLRPEFMINFPKPSISNYAKIESKHRLSAITVAFFMRTSLQDPSSRATPVSFSYKHLDRVVDNALTFLDTNNFALYIHGKLFHTEFAANRDPLWHHYAITWEKIDGKWVFYVDGKVIETGHAGKNNYMHPGTFILGQEQDDIGGRFSTLEAFTGDLTEFNVWDYALTMEEIKRISSSCGNTGNVIPWYIVREAIYGDVIVSENGEICQSLGFCPENSCDCFYSNSSEEFSCKNDVEDCVDTNTCSNGQQCISNAYHSFCSCDKGFEGRRCEYDVDECFEKNGGGCSHICVNENGSYHCECPEDMFLSEDEKTCKDTSYCLQDGQTYVNGESWVDFCQKCACNQGIVECEGIVCNKTDCPPGETEIFSPGECCPKCIAWSFCWISPTNTVMSFDSSMYQIEGQCTYTAIEDCTEGRFKIEVESPRNSTNKTNLIIYHDCHKIVISAEGNVLLDDRMVTLPLINEELIIENYFSIISVKTKHNLLIQWNFTNEAFISVPEQDVKKMCGVCSKMEDYFLKHDGRFPLSERFTSGENECFVVTENYEEAPVSGSLDACTSGAVFPVLIISVFMYFIAKNRLT